GSERLLRIGKNLFLLAGLGPQHSRNEVDQPQASACESAQEYVAAARKAGDRRAEGSALTDLGVAQLNAGDARRALAVLEEAVAIAREVADRRGEIDALGNLGLASVSAGQPQRALQIFEHLRAYAHDA